MKRYTRRKKAAPSGRQLFYNNYAQAPKPAVIVTLPILGKPCWNDHREFTTP